MFVNFKGLMEDFASGENRNIPDSIPSEAHKKKCLERYVKYVNDQDYSEVADMFADGWKALDPYGSEVIDPSDMGRLCNVPFHPKKCVQTGPVRTTFSNKAAVPFTLYVDVDGHGITIDIIDVMTFNSEGKITMVEAFWGRENVTIIN